MTPEEFSNKYKDLVFVPLGISDFPFTSEQLSVWSDTVNDEIKENSGITDDETIYQALQKHYNTKNVFGVSSVYRLTKKLEDGGRIIRPEFQEHFPYFQDWLESLPFIKNRQKLRLSMLRQTPNFRTQFKCPDYAPIHYDQPGCFSLRIWVNNRKNRMFMIPRKFPILSNNETTTGVYSDTLHAKDEQGNLITTQQGYPVPTDDHHNIHLLVSSPNENDIFIMNEAIAAHSLFHEQDDYENYTPDLEKFTMLLLSDDSDCYDWQYLDNQIQESIKKHPEHVVWFSENDRQNIS
jgi:hypothetical protein